MTGQTWTDNCPDCCTPNRPTDTAVHGDEHKATYRCRCGRVWMTTRSLEAYAGFFDFAEVEEPIR